MEKAVEVMSDKEYLDMFYEEDFTTYDFVVLFSTIFASQNEYSFNSDSLRFFIKGCKESNMYSELLHDIKFKSNGIFWYSEDLYEAILKAKFAGILYTISPEVDATVYISKNIPMAGLLKPRLEQFDTMAHFISDYRKYDETMINEMQKIYCKDGEETTKLTEISNKVLNKVKN